MAGRVRETQIKAVELSELAGHLQVNEVWDLETGPEITSLRSEASTNCCAIAPAWGKIFAGSKSGCVYFLRMEADLEFIELDTRKSLWSERRFSTQKTDHLSP